MSRLLQVPEGTIPVAYIETLHMLPDGSPRRFRRPLLWPYSKFPHALIVGGTGSGKTSFFKVMLSSFIRYEPEAELYLCSYKTRMEDFAFWKPAVISETSAPVGTSLRPSFRGLRTVWRAVTKNVRRSSSDSMSGAGFSCHCPKRSRRMFWRRWGSF